MQFRAAPDVFIGSGLRGAELSNTHRCLKVLEDLMRLEVAASPGYRCVLLFFDAYN